MLTIDALCMLTMSALFMLTMYALYIDNRGTMHDNSGHYVC